MEKILKKKKRVLIHTIVFNPDGVSTAYLYNDIAYGLMKKGREVIVLTTTPHYNNLKGKDDFKLLKRFGGLFYTSIFKDIKVYHLPMRKFKWTLFRLLSFIYWHTYSIIFGIFIKGVSTILSPSPPLTIGLVSLFLAKIKGSRLIYNVQELYPDILIEKGISTSIIIKPLKLIELLIYRNCDFITAINPDFVTKLKARVENQSKVLLIPNFVDTSLYKPIEGSINLPEDFRESKDKFIIMYAGNIGIYQDWGPILYAAKELEKLNIVFWIIGEGVAKPKLIKAVSNKKLRNVKLYPYQKRDLIPNLINYANINLISVDEKIEALGFPSKVYTIMACGKPSIVIAGQKSPIYKFLEQTNSAILIDRNRNENFVSAIKHIRKNPSYLRTLGENAYKVVTDNYTAEKVIAQYLDIL